MNSPQAVALDSGGLVEFKIIFRVQITNRTSQRIGLVCDSTVRLGQAGQASPENRIRTNFDFSRFFYRR